MGERLTESSISKKKFHCFRFEIAKFYKSIYHKQFILKRKQWKNGKPELEK
jgi:hypothetical protein